MAAKTYARRFGRGGQHEMRVTVMRFPGLVIEASSDDVRGAGPVSKHHTGNVRRTAREITRRLLAQGYEEVPQR